MDITRNPPPASARAPSPAAPGGWGRLLRGAVDLTLPAACLGCGHPSGGAGHLGLCLHCRGRLVRSTGPALGCATCGEPIPGAALSAFPEGWTCGACRGDPPPLAALVVPFSYDGPIAAVVRALKFGRLDYLGAHLAAELAPEVARALERRPGRGAVVPDVVVPVPLHWRRRWTRGYNQAERIARPLARRLGLPYVEALRRRRATPPQTGLDRARRLAGPRRAFAVRRHPARPESRALLVDDVVTTGATLCSAARALRRAGFAEVLAVAVARTPEAGGRSGRGGLPNR